MATATTVKSEAEKLAETIIKPLKKSAATIPFAPKEESKPILVPKAIGAAADRMYEVRQARYQLQKVVDRLQAEESGLAEYLIRSIPKSEASGVAGKTARATINKKEKPRVTDWEKLWAYILKTKATDMLQRRVSEEAVVSRWEAKKKIPGVESFEVVSVSLNKV